MIKIKIYKKKLFLFIFKIIFSISIFSVNPFKADFLLFKNINELNLIYKQKINGENEESITKIYKTFYAQEEILITKTISDKYEVTVYLKFNGELIKTNIIDKKGKIRYLVEYNKKIRIVKTTKDERKEVILNEWGYDTSALAVLLSVFQFKKEESIFLNIIDYKNFEAIKIKLEIIDENIDYELGNMKIKSKMYKISSFLLYDSIFYYSFKPFPILLYYEGPTSINFLDRTEIMIKEDSYTENRKLFFKNER